MHLHSTSSIWVRVDERNARESGCSLDSWGSHGIADELSIVQLHNRSRDRVVSRRDYPGEIMSEIQFYIETKDSLSNTDSRRGLGSR
jgi:hypothetical protein